MSATITQARPEPQPKEPDQDDEGECLTPLEAEWLADLWKVNRASMLRFVSVKVKDPDEARDILQDLAVWLLTPRIYRMMGEYPGNERFRKFAFHLLKFLLGRRNRHRNGKTFGRQISAPEDQPLYQDPIDRFICRPASRKWPQRREDSCVVEAVLQNERREAVGNCLALLRTRDREVIVFTEGMGATNREAVERFCLSKSGVENCKRRALSVLRERVPAWLKPEDSFGKAVLRLYRQDVPTRAIANRLGCAYPNVARFLRREGLPTDRGFTSAGRHAIR